MLAAVQINNPEGPLIFEQEGYDGRRLHNLKRKRRLDDAGRAYGQAIRSWIGRRIHTRELFFSERGERKVMPQSAPGVGHVRSLPNPLQRRNLSFLRRGGSL